MRLCLMALSAISVACTSPAWAATSSVDVYGTVDAAPLPASAIFSQAGAVTLDDTTLPLATTVNAYDQTETSGATAAISDSSQAASARSSLGGNHAYASQVGPGTGSLVMASANWFDRMTITGGSGTGTASFTVHLHGTATVGASPGIMGYQLGVSSVHPYDASNSVLLNGIGPLPSPFVDPFAIRPVVAHGIEFRPYSDPAPTMFPCGTNGTPVGLGDCPAHDQTLGAGAHVIDLTLTGSLDFTYDAPFYLIGQLGVMTGEGLRPFMAFGDMPPAPDGAGPTTLDFFNSATLGGITLPSGALLNAASGNPYSVTVVPEPGQWLLLLAGLAVIGWRGRSKAS